MLSKGAASLAHICKQQEGGQTAVGARLGKHQSVISQWVTGERTPNAQARAKLEDEFGIDWRAWDEKLSEEPPPDTERAT